MNIPTIRNDFPALDNYIWFQNGGVSITPRPVADEHARLMRELLQRGPMHIVHPDEENSKRERSIRANRRVLLGRIKPTGADARRQRGVSDGAARHRLEGRR